MISKKWYILVGIFVVGVVLGFIVPRYRDAEGPASSVATDNNHVPEGPVVHQVALLADRAEPDTVLVKVGEFVQFNGQDGKQHDIAEGKGNDYDKDHDHPAGGLQSGIFEPDEGYKVEFKKPGTYYFHDNLNPNIAVTVVAYIPESR